MRCSFVILIFWWSFVSGYEEGKIGSGVRSRKMEDGSRK
jgi:hypothetical protein